jgi:hypothetical protein
MPRPRNAANEVGRQAQERYRDRLADKGQPEVDAVDTAVAVALAVYADGARALKSDRDVQMVEGVEAMAINYLSNRGSSVEEATKRVIARLRRLDDERLRPFVKPPKKPSGETSAIPITRLF